MATNEVNPEGQPRAIDAGGVDALDAALGLVARGGEVLHALDPRRAIRFEHGGPPLWSVAFATTADAPAYTLYCTYGLSRAIDPAAPFDFELSFGVPAGEAGLWAAMLLRGLAHHARKAERALRVGDVLPLFRPLSRAMLAPSEASTAPDTRLRAIAIAKEPLLRGPCEVQRVVGLHDDEVELHEVWSTEGFLELLGSRDPRRVTALGRPSVAADAGVVAAVEAAAAREGSATHALPLPGASWAADGHGFKVTLPGGPSARRLLRLLRARIGHGRPLLVEDPATPGGAAIGFRARREPTVADVGDGILEIGGPPALLYEILEDKLEDDPVVLHFAPDAT